MAKKEKPVFATPYNGRAIPKGEVNSLPSLTVPDQTIGLQEMLERHTKGMPLPNLPMGTQPYYNEDVELPNLRAMDFTDIDALRRNTADEIEFQKRRLAKLNLEKREIIKEREEEARRLSGDKPDISE